MVWGWVWSNSTVGVVEVGGTVLACRMQSTKRRLYLPRTAVTNSNGDVTMGGAYSNGPICVKFSNKSGGRGSDFLSLNKN